MALLRAATQVWFANVPSHTHTEADTQSRKG